MRRSLALLSLSLLLSACSHHSPDCSENGLKQDLIPAVYSYYLYLELLPTSIDPAAYATVDELLGALTATAQAQGKDRGWSFLMPEDQYLQYFQQGQTVGYGFSVLTTGAAPTLRVFVKQVFEGSASAGAGFARGDEILEAGPDDGSPLTAVAGLDADSVSVLLSAGGVAGVAKKLLVAPVGGGAQVTRTMTSAAYDLHPVASVKEFGTTGYVQLRTFVSAAETDLRSAFAGFKKDGMQSVVVDLRYNGGGSVDTAALLADLLGEGLGGQKMVDLRFNGNHPEATAQGHLAFQAQPESGTFQRIAFITTSASASASEMVPNALDAYLPIAYVGTTTYGKPVGQMTGTLGGCNTVLFLIAFRLVNADGVTDYYQGLPKPAASGAPGSNGPLCGAADDLTQPQDSDTEASTAAAIHFAQNGSCPPAAAAARTLAPAAPIDQLGGAARTVVQRDMPGTF